MAEKTKNRQEQLVESVFVEPDTFSILYSKSKIKLAWMIKGFQRLAGKQNITFQRPWRNPKTGFWTLKLVIDIPNILLKNQGILGKEHAIKEAKS